LILLILIDRTNNFIGNINETETSCNTSDSTASDLALNTKGKSIISNF